MPATQVNVYSWMDANAPNPTNAYASYEGHKSLLNILKACLVDGYGSQPGAGWTLENWDMTPQKERAAFSNGNGVLEVIGMGADGTGFVIWESVSAYGAGNVYYDKDTPETLWSTGINPRCDYNSPFTADSTNQMNSTYVKYLYGAQFANGDLTDGYGWRMYATDKTFFFHVIPNPDSVSYNAAQATCAIYAGAIIQPGIERDTLGNMICVTSPYTNRNSIPGTSQWAGYFAYVTSLLDPLGNHWTEGDVMRIFYTQMNITHFSNLYSVYVPHTPLFLYYDGPKTPDATAIAAGGSEDYTYACLSGFRQMIGAYGDILMARHYHLEGATEQMPFVEFEGYPCVPISIISSSSGYRGQFISTDPQYWA